MNLNELLTFRREEIVHRATDSLSRTPLRHYNESDLEENKNRLGCLFDLTTECIIKKDLIPMLEFSRKIAEERYHQHFDLEEVHVAYNVLEEVIWNEIEENIESENYPQAFGLVSTVLGFGKESLAVTYLSLVSNNRKLKSLDLSTLFRGI